MATGQNLTNDGTRYAEDVMSTVAAVTVAVVAAVTLHNEVEVAVFGVAAVTFATEVAAVVGVILTTMVAVVAAVTLTTELEVKGFGLAAVTYATIMTTEVTVVVDIILPNAVDVEVAAFTVANVGYGSSCCFKY